MTRLPPPERRVLTREQPSGATPGHACFHNANAPEGDDQ